MKQIFLIGILFLAISFTSCKKDRHCTCTDGRTFVIHDSKKKATTTCEGYGYTATAQFTPNYGYLYNPSQPQYNYQPAKTISCTIK
jgi:hypothetical protein